MLPRWPLSAALLVSLLAVPVRAQSVYRHPAGFSLTYPASWTLQASEESVQIAIAGADAASFFLLFEPAQGVTRADDPQVIGSLDAQVKDLAPYLARQGNGEMVPTGVGQGMVYTWSGRNPNGQEVAFRVYTAIAAEQLVQLTAVGPAAVLAAKDAELRQVFGTLSTGGAAPAPGGNNPLGGPGGNPLGVAADPFAGTYAGENIQLVLQGGNGQYTGTLTFQGQQFPVAAELRGQTLHGTFEVNGQRYMFAATKEGQTLKLTSDGNEYRLQQQGAPAPPAGPNNPLGGPAQPAPAGGAFSGTWTLPVQNGVNTLTLTQQGATVTGTLKTADGSAFKVEGQVEGGLLAGGMYDEQGGIYFEAKVAGNQLQVSHMDLDPNTRQPKRESAVNVTYTRQAGGAAPAGPGGMPRMPLPQGTGGTAPPAGGQPPAAPVPQAGGDPAAGAVPLQPGRAYQGGERAYSAAAGVSFQVPQGYQAQLPADGGLMILGDGQGRLAIVGAALIVPEQPTPQQLGQEFIALLANPALLGEGVQLQLAAQPQIQGNQIQVVLQGQNQNGPIAAQIVGVVSPSTGNEAVVAAFGSAGDPAVQQLAQTVAGSFRFGPGQGDAASWYQQLAGRTLTTDGGSHSRTSPNTTLSSDSRTTIQLGQDGGFAYQYRSLGSVTGPGGLGGTYDNSDSAQGRWRIFTGLAGSALLLSCEGDKEPMLYSLGVENGNLVMNGSYWSVN